MLSILSFDFFQLLILLFGLKVMNAYFFSHLFILIITLIITYFLSKKLIPQKSKIIFSLLFIFFNTSISFWNNPFFPEDFENRKITLELNQIEIEELNQISTNKITCFFLSTCHFCEIASDYLNKMYISGQIKDIKIVYFAHQTTADSIVKSRGIEIPYEIIDNDSFFKFSGNSFPVVLYKEQENQLKKWVGNDVNFACFDYLTSKQ